MPRPRFVPADIASAVEEYARRPETRRVLRVLFPAANTPCAVVHGLQADPSSVGRRIIRANATVIDAPGVPWTYDLAYLQADVAAAEAWVEFFILEQELRDA